MNDTWVHELYTFNSKSPKHKTNVSPSYLTSILSPGPEVWSVYNTRERGVRGKVLTISFLNNLIYLSTWSTGRSKLWYKLLIVVISRNWNVYYETTKDCENLPGKYCGQTSVKFLSRQQDFSKTLLTRHS